jgi:FtsH-binding integral membrane protein
MTVFFTGSDFSFLRPAIMVFSWLAFALIVCSILFGFGLGTWFAFAMVGLASAFIIYTTSNILHHYRTDQHVGAALELFAAVALMFWYVLQILMRSRD